MIRRLLLILGLLIAAMPAARAVNPDEVLANPALESRARSISAELRCMICQNQSIDDSNADLARDLRLLVRERLTAGDSNAAVIDYVVSRYGEFVLLNPRFEGKTLLLWGAPLLLLVCGIAAMAAGTRRRIGRAAGRPLTQYENERLAAILYGNGPDSKL